LCRVPLAAEPGAPVPLSSSLSCVAKPVRANPLDNGKRTSTLPAILIGTGACRAPFIERHRRKNARKTILTVPGHMQEGLCMVRPVL
jgi:hypothetical protein